MTAEQVQLVQELDTAATKAFNGDNRNKANWERYERAIAALIGVTAEDVREALA